VSGDRELIGIRPVPPERLAGFGTGTGHRSDLGGRYESLHSLLPMNTAAWRPSSTVVKQQGTLRLIPVNRITRPVPECRCWCRLDSSYKRASYSPNWFDHLRFNREPAAG
jgi:hypothetical protein